MPLSSGFLDRAAPTTDATYLGFVKGRVLISHDELAWVQEDTQGQSAYLGTFAGRAIFAQDLSHLDTPPGSPTDLWMLPQTLAQRISPWPVRGSTCCAGMHETPFAPSAVAKPHRKTGDGNAIAAHVRLICTRVPTPR